MVFNILCTKKRLHPAVMRPGTISCLLTCLLFPGASAVGAHQHPHLSVPEGGTAVLECLVDDGDMQDFGIQWLKQLPSAAPMFLLYQGSDSSIRRSEVSPGQYQPIRNSSHGGFLQITNVTAQDSAWYWCVLTRNDSYPVWGDGTRVSVYGGKDVQAPSVSLLTSPDPGDDTALLYALCLVTGFYPPVIEVTWKFEDEPLKENIMSGPFLEEGGDNVYTMISIIGLPPLRRRNLPSVSCEVRHDSSRTLIHKDLHHCYRDT
ncbi:immunoglobulin lambda-1 light chain-like [Engystomops pustulosus]|uniref:immunoglobulin lambda-1 light chain-like n=1 Tax=Engystomops pustulosus TaxID=76066 RepID=UPI003AFA0987